jgi:serine/threonine protein kinase
VRIGERLGDRFDIEAIAGEGGMGTVYRAADRATGRPVAVKVLSTSESDDRSRFEHEAQVVGELDHPNLVRYVAHGFTGGRAYLVLEWLEGEDLEARLARDPLSARDALRLGAILARALGFAHARGVVHRDVKPANVFLVGGRIESAKILDFGIALSMDTPHKRTRTGTSVGTPAYMAPEQARGERTLDARADVFSLGCVLFECLAGRPPFVAANVMAILAKVLFEDAPRLSEIRLDIPPELDHLIACMMSKSPSARPGDCQEIARALEAIEPASSVEFTRARLPSEGPLEITRWWPWRRASARSTRRWRTDRASPRSRRTARRPISRCGRRAAPSRSGGSAPRSRSRSRSGGASPRGARPPAR